MKLHAHDPQLTAYALNELDPKTKAQVEKALEQDPSLREEVAAIRRLGLSLDDALQAGEMPAVALTESQRQAIRDEASAPPPRQVLRPPLRRRPLVWASAAAVALAAGVTLFLTTQAPGLAPMRSIRNIGFGWVDANVAGEKQEAGVAVEDRQRWTPGEAGELPKAPVVTTRDVAITDQYETEDEADESPARGEPDLVIDVGRATTGTPAFMGVGATVGEATRRLPSEPRGTESYDHLRDNRFRLVKDAPLSTFSIDVDTASYSNVRRFLTHGRRPPIDAVRIEEMINYFRYDYSPPRGKDPFAVHLEAATCPWNRKHRLVRIGLKGRVIAAAKRPAINLVFLVDVSGSMRSQNKLPLVKQGLQMLVKNLREGDRVALAVYAGASGLVLPSTPYARRNEILAALNRLSAGGSTNGGAGIELAYRTAVENRIEKGVNRVILCTDGDFNVGVTSRGSLVRLIEEKARTGVFLSVLGFGMGNYKDDNLEQLADKGNGNYAYIDRASEAKKVLVDQMTGTLVTIAKDVKIQVDFNHQQVEAYRLIGYVNRRLRKEDFANDKVDAGEIGAGHSVTALYEVVPVGAIADVPEAEPSKYRARPVSEDPVDEEDPQEGELLTVRLCYKEPAGHTSTRFDVPFADRGGRYDEASRDFKHAAAVAGFGMLLRRSEGRGDLSYEGLLELARDAARTDPDGYRKEFVALIEKARALR